MKMIAQNDEQQAMLITTRFKKATHFMRGDSMIACGSSILSDYPRIGFDPIRRENKTCRPISLNQDWDQSVYEPNMTPLARWLISDTILFTGDSYHHLRLSGAAADCPSYDPELTAERSGIVGATDS